MNIDLALDQIPGMQGLPNPFKVSLRIEGAPIETNGDGTPDALPTAIPAIRDSVSASGDDVAVCCDRGSYTTRVINFS